MPEQHDLHYVQAEGQHDCRAEYACYDGYRQRRHQDTLGRERAEKHDVEDGRRDQPGAGSGAPQMSALARDIENRLATVHKRNDRQRPQSIAVEVEGKAPDRETGDTEDEIAEPQNDAGDGEVTDPPDIGDRRRPNVVGCRRQGEEIAGHHHQHH